MLKKLAEAIVARTDPDFVIIAPDSADSGRTNVTD
jgi:hypothetical protein